MEQIVLETEESPINTKVCTKCNRELWISCFCKNKNQKSGLHPSCKDCVRQLHLKIVEKYIPGRKHPEGTMFVCSKCNINLSIEHFVPAKTASGYYPYCINCKKKVIRGYRDTGRYKEADCIRNKKLRNNRSKEVIETDRIKNREYHLISKYGISLEEWDSLLLTQNGVCAICKREEPLGRWNRWYVDHNHKTKKIRGLLCLHCNTALGLFEDDTIIALTAVDYLLRYFGKLVPNIPTIKYKTDFAKKHTKEWDQFLSIQNNSCGICKKTQKDIKLCVDHDHRTGCVRGLLCSSCNKALGLLQDEVAVVNAAAYYLMWDGKGIMYKYDN